MPASADAIRKKARITVHLPVLDVDLEMRRYCGMQMLEAGVGSLILFHPDSETAESDAAAFLDQARRIICACSVSPRIVPGEASSRSEISVHDLPEEDVICAYSQVVTYYRGLFVGADRVTDQGHRVDPKTGGARDMLDYIMDRQQLVSRQIDDICVHYHLSPLEVLEWGNEQIALVMGIIEGADTQRRIEKAHAEAEAGHGQ